MAITDIDRLHKDSGSARTMTRQGRETAERVLDAALSIFASYGLRGSRLDQIAEAAGLSKTNLLYYARSKDELYRAVLERTLSIWLEPLKALDASSDPQAAITAYIERKLEYSRDFPEASRLFAQEIMSGAEALQGLLATDLRSLVEAKAAIMRRWMSEGRMTRIDPVQFIFLIWATTQHYADFSAQVKSVVGRDLADPAFFNEARTALVERLTAGLFP
jgi:TetR/AcrR family transcriptional regulator